MLISNKHKAY